MEEESTVRDELKKMNENFEKVLASNPKMIKPKKLGRSSKKKGFVNYIYIRDNGTIDTFKLPIEESTTVYEGVPRIATPDHVLNWKNNPTIIQPSWSTQPFSPVENLNEAIKNSTLAVGWRLLANRAEQGDIKTKKKMSGTTIIIILAVIAVAAYFLLK